jgi:16S rRNA (guanine966-N2)-methyltransferase
MRIISGSAGGIPIVVPKSVLRPTTDRVREAVFSMLGERVLGAHVLDLFCGSGAYGLECLSRGAAQATFVDVNRGSAQAITQTLEKARLRGGETQTGNCESWLKRPPPRRFDLVFADPPFAKRPGDRAWNTFLLTEPHLLTWLAPDGILILESFAKDLPIAPPESGWHVSESRRYGDVSITFFTHALAAD